MTLTQQQTCKGSETDSRTLFVCRHGHNEMDEPRATLPLTCAAIDAHPRVLQLYLQQLGERLGEGAHTCTHKAANEKAPAQLQIFMMVATLQSAFATACTH